MSYPRIISRIKEHSEKYGDSMALLNPNSIPSNMTYRELFRNASNLARYIIENVNDTNPIIVYGHKNPYMIVCFLACTLSGHAYCPIDVTMPQQRIEMILKQTQSSLILSTEDLHIYNEVVLELSTIIEICNVSNVDNENFSQTIIHGNQTYYIIFTSGSTGVPKGVEITANDLDNFLDWSKSLGEEAQYDRNTVFLNQAPFSFDLSVMDLYTSLFCGSTLCMMEKVIQKDISLLTPFIQKNRVTAIVSTPSFMNVCLVDKSFNAENIPSLTSFFFCGETLSSKTAAKVLKRFPSAVIQNTYGPTESTVAVSSVRITEKILEKYDPLPVGRPKNGTTFYITDNEAYTENGHKIGEVLIAGDTLAKGYFKRDDLTSKSFIEYQRDEKTIRAYRSGDLGYLYDDYLFYCGRIDLQIKLNGYRIEIGEIESCILKNDFVDSCAVLPRIKDGKVKSLIGVIVCNNKDFSEEQVKTKVKNKLLDTVPSYMVPQNYFIVDFIPMTNNGKIDRNKLSEIIEEEYDE